jgi:hypothetical protein
VSASESVPTTIPSLLGQAAYRQRLVSNFPSGKSSIRKVPERPIGGIQKPDPIAAAYAANGSRARVLDQPRLGV